MRISPSAQYQTCNQWSPLQFLYWQNFKCHLRIGRSQHLKVSRYPLSPCHFRQFGEFTEQARHLAPFFHRAFTSLQWTAEPRTQAPANLGCPRRFLLCRALELVRRRDLPIVALFTPPQSRSPCHLPASSPAATAHCSQSPPSSSSHARQQTPLALLSTATASASTPPFHLHRENSNRAAPVSSASK